MKQYLDITALAERFRIKRSTLYAWAEQGTIPHFKLGRLLRFDSDEIEVWLQNQRRESISEAIRPGHRHGTDNVDTLIAEAKRAVYTAGRGKPDQDRATRKGEPNGSV